MKYSFIKMGDKCYQKCCPLFQGLEIVWEELNEVFFRESEEERRPLGRSLYTSLVCSAEVIDDIATKMYSDECQWPSTVLGHTFSLSRPICRDQGEGSTIVGVARSWLRTHEEAQVYRHVLRAFKRGSCIELVMLASVLVVVGLWWLVRAVLTLLINLVCPLLVVILAVVCVPQLREPLLGQNYPLLANLLRNILLKMAENIRP